ncbi:MAG: glycosyltransferase [Piscinibacter sp.]|uniref:glycosyltransferase n=1 Tax=Piscinibacter sp. TaxID=1903157 RepID=UPI003D0BBEA1
MKRVSVFAPMGTLDHQTGILNAANSFAAAGYEVEVLTVRNRRFEEVRFESPRIRVRAMPIHFDSDREPRALVTLLFLGWVLLAFWRSHPLVFAGGIRGLLAAYGYALFRRCSIVNYQTELYIGAKLDTRGKKLFKALERRAARRSLLTIEHDASRRELLVADLGVDPRRVAIVPNAPRGPAAWRPSDFLHRRLGLEPDTPILLSPGSLSEFFASSLVVEAAQHLAPPWRCVVHSAQPRSRDEPYIRRLLELDKTGRTVFSLDPIPYDQIDALLGSAAVGMALYSSEVGQNTSSVGLASGKLSHFLKLGIPVIVSPLPGLADFVREHGVGDVLESAQQLPELIARIERDAQGYRRRALACFDAHLAYERAFESVLAVTDPVAEREA